MGREWYWGGGRGGKSSRRGDNGGGRREEEERENGSLPSGCMCAAFHLFDFHQFQFAALNQQPSSTLKPNSFIMEDSPIPMGAEGPRNCLEQEEPSFPSTRKEKTLDVQKQMGIQIKTSVGGHRRSTSKALNGDQPNEPSCSSSELINSYSPGTKTPNLVARLMGLDVLPDNPSSPSSISTLLNSHSHSHQRHLTPNKQLPLHPKPNRNYLEPAPRDFSGTRSLPETPRISSARRSDVDHHHRLSLQINKENVSPSEEIVLSRISSALKRKELNMARKEVVSVVEEIKSTSPANYARQIVKQVKESVSRKVGLDITNTISNRSRSDHQSREFHGHYQDKPKKISKVGSRLVGDSDGLNSSTSTCSPRLRFLEINTKSSTSRDHNDNDVPQPARASLSSDISPVPPPREVLTRSKLQKQEETGTKGSKRVVGEEKLCTKTVKKLPAQTTSDVIKNKQEEPFVRPTAVAIRANAINPDKKSKRMPLSNGLLTNMAAPTGLLPVKRRPTPPATKIPQKQVWNGHGDKCSLQLSSCSSHSYKLQGATLLSIAREDNNTRPTAASNNSITTDKDKSNTGTTGGLTPPIATVAVVTENGAAEYDYIAGVLKRSGFDEDSPVSSFARWFSPSSPLDPSVFYYLEHFTSIADAYPGQLSQRGNRKLLFQLVDEILGEFLRPYFNLKPWAGPVVRIGPSSDMRQMKGSELVDMLCTRVRSFPCADCRVLEDIDGLIERDLLPLKTQRESAFEEEGEGIVREVEEDIVDTLVHETAVVLYCRLKRHSSTRKNRRSHDMGSFTG